MQLISEPLTEEQKSFLFFFLNASSVIVKLKKNLHLTNFTQ